MRLLPSHPLYAAYSAAVMALGQALNPGCWYNDESLCVPQAERAADVTVAYARLVGLWEFGADPTTGKGYRDA